MPYVMKTVLITGASRGIGKALVKKFLENGHAVIGTSRSGMVDYSHQNHSMFPLELADTQSREACAKKITARGTAIDILVNNAGFFHPKDVGMVFNVSVLRETLETNLLGVVDFTERIVPLLAVGAHIVNISSQRGSMERAKAWIDPCYSISKAALNMCTRQLAARLAGKVTVSCAHPGYVKTDMNEGDGEISPEESADDLYSLSMSKVETGQFWFKGEKFPW